MYSLPGNASSGIPSAWLLNKLKAKLPVNHLNRFLGSIYDFAWLGYDY